ncbi:hypothetical protein C8R46DRAFT_1188739 [Mycena filopes]|nr:hypothetical protein C8R46DRAFT_1188739 [Mycena filopes]
MLHELDEDVLIDILSSLDIATVLRVSEVNKDLRQVALGRSLWISLVADLADRGFLALPPPEALTGYTSDDLIAEVRRLVVGPKTWAKGGAELASTQHTWRLKKPPSSKADIKVVSGGRYVVVHDTSSLDLWESATGRHIWASSGSITTWAVTVSDRGRTAHMVLFWFSPECAAEVVRIDLASGESNTVFRGIVGILGSDIFRNATIAGEYFAASYSHFDRDVGQRVDRILVVNWPDKTFCVLRASRSLKARSFMLAGPVLIADHIVLTWMASDEQVVAVWRLAPLKYDWLPPITEHPRWAAVFPIDTERETECESPLASTRLRLGFHHADETSRVELSVLENPLRRGAYKVILYSSYSYHHSGNQQQLCSTYEAAEWLRSWEVDPEGQRSCAALALAPYGGVVGTLGYISAKVTRFL